jgi:hypothetical protein
MVKERYALHRFSSVLPAPDRREGMNQRIVLAAATAPARPQRSWRPPDRPHPARSDRCFPPGIGQLSPGIAISPSIAQRSSLTLHISPPMAAHSAPSVHHSPPGISTFPPMVFPSPSIGAQSAPTVSASAPDVRHSASGAGPRSPGLSSREVCSSIPQPRPMSGRKPHERMDCSRRTRTLIGRKTGSGSLDSVLTQRGRRGQGRLSWRHVQTAHEPA